VTNVPLVAGPVGVAGELRTGELAAAAGVNRQTLRYYERRGLLPAPDRSLGGQRRYPPSAVTRLRVIKAAQRLGFTLDEIAELIRPAEGRSGSIFAMNATGLHGRAEAKLAEVDRRIAELQSVRDTLARALAAGCDDLIECAAHPDCPVPFPGRPDISPRSPAPPVLNGHR
jgi:DNA-binding transcriptional MerR regulator